MKKTNEPHLVCAHFFTKPTIFFGFLFTKRCALFHNQCALVINVDPIKILETI